MRSMIYINGMEDQIEWLKMELCDNGMDNTNDSDIKVEDIMDSWFNLNVLIIRVKWR